MRVILLSLLSIIVYAMWTLHRVGDGGLIPAFLKQISKPIDYDQMNICIVSVNDRQYDSGLHQVGSYK